jgi:hemerythrin superfamily protein
MSDADDVIGELTDDHREVEQILASIEALPEGDRQRKLRLEKATIELVRHSVAEEEYLYPAVREHVPDGDAIADKEIQDHARVEQLMKQLEGLEADEAGFDGHVATLITEVREHVRDEENRLFPALRIATTHETLAALGEKVRRAKRTAPTRPHPSAPDKPPANKLLAPGAGMVDRLRDALSGRGRSF